VLDRDIDALTLDGVADLGEPLDLARRERMLVHLAHGEVAPQTLELDRGHAGKAPHE
jgi:hypothetical protein